MIRNKKQTTKPDKIVKVNWSDPFSRNLVFLTSIGGGSQIDLVTQKPGIVTGTRRYGISNQGRKISLLDTESVDFSGKPTAITEVTLFAVCKFTGAHNSDAVLSTSTLNNGYRLQYGASGAANDLVLTKGGAADIKSNITLSSNVNYLLMASSSDASDGVCFLVLDLDTQKFVTSSTSNANATSAGNGTFTLGEGPFAGFGWNGDITYAGAVAEAWNIDRMRAFAKNPWRLTRKKRQHTPDFVAAAVGAGNPWYYYAQH